MKSIFLPQGVTQKLPVVTGVYALADPREPDNLRYVGSSVDVEKRLYGHAHSLIATDKTPKTEWVRQLKTEGIRPMAVVLRTFEKTLPRAEREALEREFIEKHGCDLNVKLSPMGHPHTKDSYAKRMAAEVRALRKEVERLRAIIEIG